MARVKCINCDNRVTQHAASYRRKGAFALCGMCRRNPPEEYKCLAPTYHGRPCQHIKVFNSTTCAHHKEDSK
jgi:hypothetical protein